VSIPQTSGAVKRAYPQITGRRAEKGTHEIAGKTVTVIEDVGVAHGPMCQAPTGTNPDGAIGIRQYRPDKIVGKTIGQGERG